MYMAPNNENFAVVRTDDSAVDGPRIARLIAGTLEVAVADFVQALAQRHGILAENLVESVARRCVALLTDGGVEARVVPQSAIVEPPELMVLRSGRPDDRVFFYVAHERKGVVKWPDVLWLNLVAVQEVSTEEFDDLDVSGAGDGPSVRRFKNRRLVSKHPLSVDLVTYEPWLLLRIPNKHFDFSATGLPTFSAGRQNLIALAAEIALRSTKAHLGPGLKWIESNTAPHEHRVSSQSVYHGFLRWQLTRLFLANMAAGS
jgi:hypothetical protein